MLKGSACIQRNRNASAFVSQVDAFETSQNVDLKLTYHDRFLGNKLVKGFSINAYFEMFIETSNKATVVLDKATSQRGYYFQLGVDPTYAFGNMPLTLNSRTMSTFRAITSNRPPKCADSGTFLSKYHQRGRKQLPVPFVRKARGSRARLRLDRGRFAGQFRFDQRRLRLEIIHTMPSPPVDVSRHGTNSASGLNAATCHHAFPHRDRSAACRRARRNLSFWRI
jgi:hypothetical protein